jgi:Na+-transporting methylmalonyl-CoA/oxaloacetate decarboxylase gamma subunit
VSKTGICIKKEIECMDLLESVSVSLFLLAVVFFVLLCLYLCIRLFSYLLKKFQQGKVSCDKDEKI